MITDDQILEIARQDSRITAGILPTAKLVFDPSYRKYCEDNVCGSYNANYACPPYCGTPEEMKIRALNYKRALMLQTTWEIPGLKDIKQLASSKVIHNNISYAIIEKLHNLGLEPDAMMAGPCDRCSDGCKMPLNKPCPRMGRQKIYSCASAYCMDVAKACDLLGMVYMSDGNHVSFFSTILFNP